MKHYCRYHPITAARWHCPQCHIAFCRDCVPLADEKHRSGACPHCKESLQYLRERRVEEPFWARNTRFYMFPLQREPILLMVMVGLLAGLARLNPIATWLLLGLGVLLVLRYGFAVTQQCAQGKLKAPTLQVITENSGYQGTLAVFVALAVMLGPAVAAMHFDQPWLATLGTLLALLCAPALIISTLRQQHFVAALQPKSLLAAVVRLESAYLVLVFHVFFCLILFRIASDLFVQHAPAILSLPALAIFASYTLLILAALFGYVLCQYDAGAEETSDAAPVKRHASASQQTLWSQAQIDMALKEGKLGQVINLLKSELKQKRASELRRDQLYLLLQQRGDWDALLEDAEAFLNRLMVRGKYRDALQLLQQLREHHPHFRIHSLPLTLELAQQAAAAEEFRLALWLAQDAHTRFGPEPELAKLYLLAAQILAQQFKQHDKAKMFLNYVHTRLAQHLPSAHKSE